MTKKLSEMLVPGREYSFDLGIPSHVIGKWHFKGMVTGVVKEVHSDFYVIVRTDKGTEDGKQQAIVYEYVTRSLGEFRK